MFDYSKKKLKKIQILQDLILDLVLNNLDDY